MATKLNLLKKLFGKNNSKNKKFKVDKIKTTYPLIL